MNKTVYVNGKFLSQKMSGVQRYASEICRHMESTVKIVAAADQQNNKVYQLAQPIQMLGSKAGIPWEQLQLPLKLQSTGTPLLVNFCNVAPLYYTNKITCLHDIAFERYPQYFSKKLTLYYHWLIPRVLKSSRHILTVSEFSKREISDYYHIDPNHITVVPNASTFSPNPAVLTEPARPRPYFLFVGSLDPRKNLVSLLQAFKAAQLKDIDLVVVGAGHASFASSPEINSFRQYANIVFTGYVSDEELQNYYAGALALINPSFYEGFGLPIAEALSMGCPVLASAIDAFKEVGGTAIEYFNAADVSGLTDLIKNFSAKAPFVSTTGTENRTWKKSAEIVDRIIQQFN